MQFELTEGGINDTNAIPKKVIPLNQRTYDWYVLAKSVTSLLTSFEYQKLTVQWNLQAKITILQIITNGSMWKLQSSSECFI